MQSIMFTVYDQAAEAYLPPFYFGTNAQAKRAFAETVNQPGHSFFKHPQDYTLFNLGVFDDSTAKITQNPTPISMGTALEYKTLADTLPALDEKTAEEIAKLRAGFAEESRQQREITNAQ